MLLITWQHCLAPAGAPPDWLHVPAVRVTRDGVLVVEGERKQEEEKEENGFKRYERVYGQFVRRFRLVRWHAKAFSWARVRTLATWQSSERASRLLL